jgi:hypothetical protein
VFCIHGIGSQIVFYRNIYKNGRPTRVFQMCIRVWIVCEKKTFVKSRRTWRYFVSLIGIRPKKTSVKCNFHLQINIKSSYIYFGELYSPQN